MSIIMMLIIGGIIGWLAAAIAGRDEGILGSIAIGVVGSVIGGFLASMFNSGNQAFMALTWGSLVWSLIGAVILVAVLNAVQNRPHHNI
jgi:uncharacterized membrane protein YeaQ/YmgE (transglycosylase-associated protein family)